MHVVGCCTLAVYLLTNVCIMTAITKACSDNPHKQRGLTITTARKSISSYQPAAQPASFAPKHVQQPRPEVKSDMALSQSPGRREKVRKEALPTVSSVSADAIPGLRRQASAIDPEQAKQREKGWGLSFKDPAAATPTRKEVSCSQPYHTLSCSSTFYHALSHSIML